MHIDTATLLRSLDVTVTEGAVRGAWVTHLPDGSEFNLAPLPAVSHIDSRTARRALAQRHVGLRPLLVGATASRPVWDRARRGEVDVLTADPLMLIVKGSVVEVAEPSLSTPRTAPRRRTPGRLPWVRWALVRFLFLVRRPVRQGEIAAVIGVSQQSISLAAKQLQPFVADRGHGLQVTKPDALLEQWLADYPGPGGHEFGWFSLAPISEQVAAAVDTMGAANSDPLVSGDVAVDILAPWAPPTRGLVYAHSPIELPRNEFVPAPLEESTLVARIPQDPTVWRTAQWHSSHTQPHALPCTDPLIVLWDLHSSNSTDSDQAAATLRDYLFRNMELA